MTTRAELTTRQTMQVCSNCEHFSSDGFIGCQRGKWAASSDNNSFWYNPEVKTIEDTRSWMNAVIEYGIDCDQYSGDEFIITGMSADYNPVSLAHAVGKISYSINIIGINTGCIDTIEISFSSDSDSPLKKRIGNIQL